MVESSTGRNSTTWLEMDHLLEEIYRLVVHVLSHLLDILVCVALPLGERQFHLWKIRKSLPCLFGGSSKRPENLKDLSNF